MMYDVAIVGGSYAGMAAGLQLAQARRKVVVIDAGKPRNRFAARARGFLTQDGHAPDDIEKVGQAELIQYPTVDWCPGNVAAVAGENDNFTLTLAESPASATPLRARRVILAAGVKDELPSLPGLEERWGKSVFHCPYCHGFDLERGRIGVLATSEAAMHLALLLPDWGQTTLFLNDAFEPDRQQLEKLAKRDTHVERGAVERLTGDGLSLVMADSRVFALEGLFIVTQTAPNALALQLGCELEVSPLGRTIKTSVAKATSVPGIFACGDIAMPVGNLARAVSDGTLAGQAAHHSLVFDL
ncbi:NAD(P)/FAD-dependent oxidoreductase [Halomonas aquamarina]|uniref:NAD(P)/FAD-dependent oxidoreductase n=1 Tax=Vreelandella aquamarina TaxID=77097 RepID=A0ACC5VT29_9GAMM|nr:NAD(P)/FAD-dependent oxidoreductase [Halomonas aquamarina]